MTRTRTYTVLRVSRACYDEIAQQMRAAGVVTGNDGERPRLMMGDFAIDSGGYGDARLGTIDSFDHADRFLGFRMEASVSGLWLGQPARIILEE